LELVNVIFLKKIVTFKCDFGICLSKWEQKISTQILDGILIPYKQRPTIILVGLVGLPKPKLWNAVFVFVFAN
jgi:hypothetical protein